jgi:serine/threonine-protein kinase
MIHRDVKAGNVVMSPDGHVTLLDFGILRTRDAKSAITREGMVMGTPHYMAPEQALGLRDVDHRADLYSLGVLLFECLTGSLPFEAESELRLIQLQAHAPPPEILERAPWVPKAVADVVRRALAKRPEDRYSTGKELAQALETAYREAKIIVPTAGEAKPIGLTTAPSWRRRDGEPPPQLLEPSPLPPVDPATLLPGSEPLPARASGPRPSAPSFAPVETAPPTFASRLPLVAAVVFGVALVAVLVFRPGPGPVAVGAPDAHGSAVAALVPDAGAVDAGVVAAAVADAGGAELASAEVDAGSKAVAVTPPVDAGAAPKVTVVAPVPKKGHVTIVTLHKGEPWWAQVFLDGQPRGRTPLQLELAAGRYAVRVERSGFQPVSRDLVVASGKPSVMRIDLAP